jgi:hypothetical protein
MSTAERGRSSGTMFALKLAAIAVAAMIAVYCLLLSDLQRTLNWRRQRLYALGVPKTWADAAPPPVRDSENAAVLYQRAFGLLNPSDDERDVIRRFVKDDPPGAGKRLRGQVQAIIGRNRASLRLLPQAAVMPRCRFPLNWDSAPPDMVLPHLSKLRLCATMLAADALLAVREGDAARAVASYRACLGMCAHAVQEPTTISFFVTVAVARVALGSLPDVVDQVPLDAANCRALYEDLARLDFETALRQAQATEGCQRLWYFDAAERQPRSVREALRYSLDEFHQVEPALAGLYVSPLGKLARLKDESVYTELLERSLRVTPRPYRVSARRVKTLDDSQDRLPSYCLISRMLWFSPERLIIARDRAIASRAAMQVALALKAYQVKYGRYPQSVAVLREYPAWKLKEDPFSGKPFVYRRKGMGFVLYSWGEDLKDDGGQPLEPGTRRGDLVWEFRR